MKILIIIGHNLYSGVNSMVRTLSKDLQSLGFEVCISIQPAIDSNYVEGFTHFTDSLDVPYFTPYDFIDYDSYHTILLNANYQFDMISKVNTNKIFICHGMEEKESIPNNPFDAIVGISDKLTEIVNADMTIYNGIDLDVYYPETNISDVPKDAGYLYRGDIPNEIREATEKANIRLHHIRQYSDVSGFINNVDFIIGYGRVIYEGMACGRPVFVYGHHGCDGWINEWNFKELRRSNCSGYYTECKFDIDGLVEQLKLYDKKQGDINRKLAEDYLSSVEMARRYSRLIRSLYG